MGWLNSAPPGCPRSAR